MLRRLATASTILMLIGAPAWAQGPTTPAAPGQSAAMPPPTEIISEQKPNELRANSLIGLRVNGAQNEKIGKISDLLFDTQNRLSGAVVSIGGFMGIGDKVVAVPWEKLRLSGDEKAVLLDMSRDELVKAPEFRTKQQIEADRLAEMVRQKAIEEQAIRPERRAPTGPTKPPVQ